MMMHRAAATLVARNASSSLSMAVLRRSYLQPSRAAVSFPWSQRFPSQRAFSTEEKVTFTFIDAEGEAATVSATPGQSLLDVAHENDIELEGMYSTSER